MENTLTSIAKGVGIALLSTVILLLLFATLLTYTQISETIITPVIIIVTAISILIRKFIWKHQNQEKRIYEWSLSWWHLHDYHLLNF